MSLFDTMKLSASPAPLGYVKALTVWQPYASLLALEEKEFETRGWATKYRGPLAIHAAAKKWEPWKDDVFQFEKEYTQTIKGFLQTQIASKEIEERILPYGAVIALAELVDVVPAAKAEISDKERYLGDWSRGRFGWRMKIVANLIHEPVKYKGAQGLWNLPVSVLGAAEQMAVVERRKAWGEK